MMHDPQFYLAMAMAALVGLAMLTAATLAGWRGWLAMKREQITARRPSAPTGAGARIEIADLKERIRRLEAIAAGVDL